MTVDEFIAELQRIDETARQYQVGIVFRMQLTEDIRLSGRCMDITVPIVFDTYSKRLWLKAR